ncbi:MAG: SDR family NAD(P)-dependent oxidoreductase [[Clostridium] leptum]
MAGHWRAGIEHRGCYTWLSSGGCFDLYNQVKDQNIDVLINNAGYGMYGRFYDTDLEQELNMLRLNIQAVHILTKLFLRDFKKRNKGYLMNVSSSAAFSAGPLMSSYYASKAYVLRLTEAVYEELRREKSDVSVSVLCPGPVDTGFNDRAGVKFSVKGLSSCEVAAYALRKMFQKKLLIVPGALMKAAKFTGRLAPEKLMLRCSYHMQNRKGEDESPSPRTEPRQRQRGKKHGPSCRSAARIRLEEAVAQHGLDRRE